jgi:hypothetical protein
MVMVENGLRSELKLLHALLWGLKSFKGLHSDSFTSPIINLGQVASIGHILVSITLLPP